MAKRLLPIALIVLLSSPVMAFDFWDDKDFLEWDNRQLTKITNDSPGAKRVSVKIGKASAFSANPAGEVIPSTASELGSGKRGTFGGSGPVPTVAMVVSWRSALPIKQALVKYQLRTGERPSEEQLAFLERREEQHMVVLSGIPPYIASTFDTIEGAREQIYLKRKNKDNVFPEEMRVEARAGEVHLLFSRSAGITEADKDVELVVEVDGFEFKKKFSLKNMVVHGKLEL